MPETPGENLEKSIEKQKPVKINWENEFQRTDIKHLRDSLGDNATLEDVRAATEKPFAVNRDDYVRLNKIQTNYRERMRAEGKHRNGDYDNSVFQRVWYSFIAHKMDELGVSNETVTAFRKLIDLMEVMDVQTPNFEDDDEIGKANLLAIREQTQELKKFAEAHQELNKIGYIVQWGIEYFHFLDDMSFREQKWDANSLFGEEYSEHPILDQVDVAVRPNGVLGKTPIYDRGSFGRNADGSIKEGYVLENRNVYGAVFARLYGLLDSELGVKRI